MTKVANHPKSKDVFHKGFCDEVFLGAVLAFALVGLSSCENSDQTTLSSAQSCLDKATDKTSANACVAQLGTLRTPDAYLIICSAHFIAQGFTTPRFVKAYNTLTESSSGSNATAQSLSFMSFDKTSGSDGSVQTLSDCTASGVQSLTRLAVLTQMATLVGSVAAAAGAAYDPTVGYTPAAIATAVTNYVAGGGDPAALGTTAITANQAYCATGSSYATTSICTTLGASITAGASPTAIGNALIAQLQVAH